MPWVTPFIVLGYGWRFLLDSQVGLLHHALQAVGIAGQATILNDPKLALPMITFISGWKGAPFMGDRPPRRAEVDPRRALRGGRGRRRRPLGALPLRDAPLDLEHHGRHQWRKHWDPKTRLLLDRGADWTWPARYGYASVGRITAAGSGVDGLAPGELVFAYVAHGTANIAPARAVVPLGPIADPALGVFLANVNTAYNGVLDARPALGSDVVVSGLGIIGQIVVRLLKRAGVRTIIAVDGIGPRRERARAGGADHVLDPRSDGVAEAVRDLTGGRGADVVIEVSGAAPALNEAIRTVGYNGLVVAMSWYGGSFETLSLSGEFHHNRTRVVSSQVGAVNPDLGPLWSVPRRAATTSSTRATRKSCRS